MHGGICQYDETRTKHSETYCVRSQSSIVETEGAQDGGTRYLDVKAILVVNETQSADFIDDQAFEAKVEN